MRCLNCNRDELVTGTEVCPGCGVHLPSLLRDMLPPGTVLHHGKYRVDHALGWGGFGITYLAEHVSLEQVVAVKEFYPRDHVLREGVTGKVSVRTSQKDSYERALRRFVREGQTLARLDHPGVVRVRDQFEENGTAYLVMDYVSPARTLREELDAQASCRLPDARVREIGAQLVSALEAVHEKGIFHLDIKPENVLLKASGQAVLIDFGASRQGLGTRTTQAFTIDYAAPEVVVGGEVGPESDIYELGMMIHEMLTGERPPAAFTRLMKDEWHADALAGEWRELVASALRLQKEERPRSVRAWWGGVGKTEAAPTVKLPTPQLPTQSATIKNDSGAPAEQAGAQATLISPPPLRTEVIAPPPFSTLATAAAPAGRRTAVWVALGVLLVAGIIGIVFAMSGSDETPSARSTAAANVTSLPVNASPMPADAFASGVNANKSAGVNANTSAQPAGQPEITVSLPPDSADKSKGTVQDVPAVVDERDDGDPASRYEEPPPTKPTPAPPRKIATISGGVLNGKAISKPAPAYPPIAKAARASGAVTVQITVDESGRVVSAQAVSGHPLLQQAAANAVRQWRFTPTLMSGQPVKVTGTVIVNFNLQ